ncbi:MAG: phage virion morphogenesis protein [Paracoccaceae bacterium]
MVLTDIGLEEALAAVGRLTRDWGFREAVAELVAAQTKIRIDEEKRAPDGTAWPAWSAGYAATRRAHHSLLLGEGELQEAIIPYVIGDTIGVGTNLIYAASHQFGSRDGRTPAREFLGLSDENRDEIEELAQDWFEELLQ